MQKSHEIASVEFLLWSHPPKCRHSPNYQILNRRLGKDPNLVYESSWKLKTSPNFSLTRSELEQDSWWNGPNVVCKGDNSSLR